MASATLTSKGQLTIPKEVRDALQVRAGDVLDFRQESDGSFRIRARKVHATSLAGVLHRQGQRRVSLEEMDAAIAEGSRRTRTR